MAFPADKLPIPAPIEDVIDHILDPETGLETTASMITTMNPAAATTGELAYIRMVTAILMTVCVAMVNMAIGAAIGKVEIMRQWRVPGGVLIGSITQHLLFPLLALTLAYIFQLGQAHRLGMLIVAICPGGAMANVVAFFIDGNITLSTSLILVSTIISMGYVPIVLLIMTHGSTSGSVAVSLWAVGIAIVIIAIPLFMGTLIRSIKESWADVVVVIGITCGLMAFTANSLFHLIIHTYTFHSPVRVYFATLILPVLGFVVAWLAAWLCGQHPVSRHTLAVSAVFHNTSLAILILATTFSHSDHWKEMVVVPTIYGPITVVYGIIYMITYLAVGVSDSPDDGTTNETTSGYLPIDEPARGNNEYQTLNGDDDDYAVEITRQGSRLRMKGYEVMNGSVYTKPITIPELE